MANGTPNPALTPAGGADLGIGPARALVPDGRRAMDSSAHEGRGVARLAKGRGFICARPCIFSIEGH